MTESGQHDQRPGGCSDSDPFERRLARTWPVNRWADLTTLIAVSGGADSMALAQSLRAIRPLDAVGRLILVHFNHRLRANESDADEAFVVTWSHQSGLPLIVGRSSEPISTTYGLDLRVATSPFVSPKRVNPKQGHSENSWRRARYAFFEYAAGLVGARYLATAHTADDQVETVVQRIVRGTGIAGLAGIPFARRINDALTVIRPLLGVSRRSVEGYLARQRLPFRTDSSNASVDFQRNRVRHETLPALARLVGRDPRAAILNLAKAAREVQAGLIQRVLEGFDRCIQIDTAQQKVMIRGPMILKQPAAEQRETLALLWRQMGWPLEGMGRRQWRQLIEAVAGKVGATNMLPGGIRLEQTGSDLCLWREPVE
jgi:tRNA(Ile)-lysidine synthase